jgi:diguanylate cyclase (GGDEF)-like protein
MAALCALSAWLSFLLVWDLKRRHATEKDLLALAATDGLTGLSNRWHFDETARHEWLRAQRERTPVGLVMIDADLFKAYNDSHGHQAGDQLLKTIGSSISACLCRSGDLGARYGGDEFAVLLPNTSLAGAARVADQIRAHFAAQCSQDGAGDDARVSMGAAALVANPQTELGELLAASDRALYRAKSDGRNCTRLAEFEYARSKEASQRAVQRAA